MQNMLTTLMLAAPDWVVGLTGKKNIFWADYVVWPVIQIVIVLFIVLTVIAYLVYVERKVSAFIQARLGPMRVGPWGLLQPLADGLKLLLKEDIVPLKADKTVFLIAPVISVVAALVVLAVVPWGAAWATISSVNIGLLFILAVSSVGVLGLVLAGWSSNSKYSLLGALRSSAQMVSYEVALGLSIIGALMFARTLSMTGIVEAQRSDGMWYFLFQPTGFLVYLISALGETNRAPFDLPEAESELVAGYHTEYSGFRWALFMMAEYAGIIITASVAVTLFLGGWDFPGLSSFANWLAGLPVIRSIILAQNLFVILSVLVFAAKLFLVIYVYMWIRWTWPRYRYDQLMELGWKWMIPAALANIVLTGVWYVLALPKSSGGLFGFMQNQGGRLVPTGWGKVYFIAAGFIGTIPIIWAALAFINRRTRDFNLHEQRQLQVRLRQERLQKGAAQQSAGD